MRIGTGEYDPTKPPVRGQQPPLTPEYQAIWETRIAAGIKGEQYFNTQVRCLPGGMPRMMMAYEPMEVIITPEATYIHITFNNEFRRIYTDGRDWPANMYEDPQFSGYSIGRWVEEDAGGPLWRAGGGDPRPDRGTRLFRRQRHPAARGQSDRRQGARTSLDAREPEHRCATRSPPSTARSRGRGQ